MVSAPKTILPILNFDGFVIDWWEHPDLAENWDRACRLNGQTHYMTDITGKQKGNARLSIVRLDGPTLLSEKCFQRRRSWLADGRRVSCNFIAIPDTSQAETILNFLALVETSVNASKLAMSKIDPSTSDFRAK